MISDSREHAVWKNLIWAIDLFAEDPRLQRSALQAARQLAGSHATIEPVYSMCSRLSEGPHAYPESLLAEVKKCADERMQMILEPDQNEGMLPLKILKHTHTSLYDEVEDLIAYAREKKSELIVVATHAKKARARWLTGSFAEALMIQSDVPLLFVSPYWKRGEIEEIVFPTDFSAASMAAYNRVIDLAKSLNCPIINLHKVSYPLSECFNSGLSQFSMVNEIHQALIESVESKSRIWEEHAANRGVAARTEIPIVGNGSPADIILGYTDDRNCLIAMAARSGSKTVALLGGTTRSVVRGACVPVWVVHPFRNT